MSNQRIISPTPTVVGSWSGSDEGELDHDRATTIESLDMSSVDGERDHDVVGDLLPPWGAGSKSGDNELDYDGATDDGEVDRTRSGGGE